MPPRLKSPASFVKGLGRGAGRARPLFEVTGILFDSTEIETYLDAKSKIAFEMMGKSMRRQIRRSFKLAKRYATFSQLPKNDPYYDGVRKRLKIQQYYWLKGEAKEPKLPFKPSRAGGVPKIRSADSKLKEGILYDYNPIKRELLVGAAKMRGTKGKVPNVLEYGGTSMKANIAERSYVRRVRDRMTRNGQLASIFSKKMRV